jgi:hypothetical protein
MSETQWKATSYPHQDPKLLPVSWEARPDLHWEEVCRVVGFDPRGNESAWGQLTHDWNGHPEGSAVLTGSQNERQWFTILEPADKSGAAQRPYQIRRRSLHKAGRVVAYEFALADPQTSTIYPSSPRVRCRLSDSVECRRLFQEQARAWAQGEQVPWSQFMKQA